VEKKGAKVLAIASAGGHWVQLMRLTPAWDGCKVTYVTTNSGFEADVDADSVARSQSKPGFVTVREANRWQRYRLCLSFIEIAWTIIRIWPDVIITTGAAPGFFAIWVGRRLGMRTVWIDSIANAEELSLAGQKSGSFASLWLTQWPHLAKPEGPYYRGGVL